MATTFKAHVPSDGKRRDGTYNVKIRVTHNRRTLKVATHLYAGARDLTRGLNFKNREIIDRSDEIIRRWRDIVTKLGVAGDSMDVKQIVEHIKEVERDGDVFKLDFIKYGRELATKKSKGTRDVYDTALNALERHMRGKPLDISKITVKFLEGFENFICTEPAQRYSPKHGVVNSDKSKKGGRAASLYLACVRHVHNAAKKEFNDEDIGIIRIPQSPFKKYNVKKPPKAKKRAVSPKTIQAIINLPDQKRAAGPVDGFTRRDLARDCFLLSFALAGMNAADLYDCPAQIFDPDEPVIVYKRKKTRSRRDDEAEMRIRIETCIDPLIKKYEDPIGERLFCFHRHYSTPDAFNTALRLGLNSVEEAIGAMEHFTFYSARHSYATISRSRALNIDKYTIHEGLNHVDSDMKVTDSYIKRDFGNIWDANVKLLALFDWDKVFRREIYR